MTTANEITFKIVEPIGVITSYENGWNKELNRVSWNGAQAKFDIRDWSEDHQRMSRGITLSPDEMEAICEMLSGRF